MGTVHLNRIVTNPESWADYRSMDNFNEAGPAVMLIALKHPPEDTSKPFQYLPLGTCSLPTTNADVLASAEDLFEQKRYFWNGNESVLMIDWMAELTMTEPPELPGGNEASRLQELQHELARLTQQKVEMATGLRGGKQTKQARAAMQAFTRDIKACNAAMQIVKAQQEERHRRQARSELRRRQREAVVSMFEGMPEAAIAVAELCSIIRDALAWEEADYDSWPGLAPGTCGEVGRQVTARAAMQTLADNSMDCADTDWYPAGFAGGVPTDWLHTKATVGDVRHQLKCAEVQLEQLRLGSLLGEIFNEREEIEDRDRTHLSRFAVARWLCREESDACRADATDVSQIHVQAGSACDGHRDGYNFTHPEWQELEMSWVPVPSDSVLLLPFVSSLVDVQTTGDEASMEGLNQEDASHNQAHHADLDNEELPSCLFLDDDDY